MFSKNSRSDFYDVTMKSMQCLTKRWEQKRKNFDLYDKEDFFYNEQRLFFWCSRCLKAISDNNIEFCLHRCDEFTIWLIEIEIRMSNSNWSQKSLFWTNWIQLSQRLKFDWLIISSTSNEMKSIEKTLNLKNLRNLNFVCIKDLRRF